MKTSSLLSSACFRRASLVAGLLAIVSFDHGQLYAADGTWTSTTGTSWGTTGSWAGGIVPGGTSGGTNTDTATFNTGTGVSVSLGSSGLRNLKFITFDTNAGSFSVTSTGGQLWLTSGGIVQIASTLTGTGKTETFSAPITLVGGTVTFANNSADSSNVFNIGAVVANATATLGLSGANTGDNLVSGILANGGVANLGVTKTGTGTWTLTNTNTYSNATTVSAGTLKLSGAGSSASSAFTVASGATLAIDSASVTPAASVTRAASLATSGGTVTVAGTSDGATNDVITGALAMGANTYNTVTVTPDGATTAQLSAASLTRNAGSIGFFNGTNLGLNNSGTSNIGRVIFTTAPAFVGSTTDGGTAAGTTKSLGIVPYLIGEFGTTGGTATGTPNTFLTYNAGTGLRPLDLTNEYTNNAITAGNNIRITSNTSAAGAAINSLVISGGNLTISSGTMSNASGGILFTSSNSISGGTALSFTNTEGIIIVNGGGLNTSISSPMVLASATGARAVTYMVGSGSTLTLTGGFSETGPTSSGAATTITGGGTVVYNSSSVFQSNLSGNAYSLSVFGGSLLNYLGSGGVGAAILTMGPGTIIDLNGSTGNTVTTTGLSSTSGSGTIKLTNNNISTGAGSNYVFSGSITGGKGLILTGGGANNQTLSGTNTYAGGTTVTTAFGTSAGNLRLSGGNALSDTGMVTLTGLATGTTVTATLNLNNFSETIGSLNSGNSNAATQIVDNTGAGARTLTINTAVAGDGSYIGVIKNTGLSTGLSLVKKGVNTQTLSGLNTYGGSTTVQNGTLSLDLSTNTTGVLASTSALSLGGGTLSVKGAASGASSQTLGNLTLGANGGASGIVIDQNDGTGTTLTLGNTWTRGSGSTLGIDLSSGSGATLTSNPSASLTNGVISYATVKDSTGTGFATVSGGNVVRYTGASTLASGSDDATANFSTSGALALGNASRALNSLSIDASTAGSLDLGGSANVVTLTSGGLLASGSGNYAINNGQLGANNAELIVHRMGSGTLTLNSTLGGGTGTVVIDGTGTVNVTGTNTYSGGTWLNGATTQFASLSNLGTGALTLNGGTLKYASGNTSDITARTVTLVGAGGTIDTNGNNVTLTGNIASGTGGLTKTGTGTLTLSGLNAYTGDTTVNKGTLLLDLSTNTTGVVNSGSALLLGGGTLNVQGKSTGASSQTLGGLAVLTGGSSVVVNNNGGSGTTLTINNTWTRTAGAAVNFDLSSSSGNVLQSQTVSNTNGIVGGWLTITDSTGTGFATYADVAANVTNPIIRYTAATTMTTGSNASATNFVTSGNLTTTTANRSVNSLALDSSSGAGSLNLGGASDVLTITSGGLLMTGSNNYTVGNGQVGANNTELIVNQYGTGKLTLSGTVSSGTGSLTKAGPGVLELSGANTYTGATTVDGGTLALGANNAFSPGSAITLTAGTVDLQTFSTSAASLTFAAGSALMFDLGTPGNVTALLALTTSFTKSGSGTFTLDFSGSGQAGTYNLVSFTGTSFAGQSDFTIANLGSGLSGALTLDGTSLSLAITAIPEPSTYAALFGALALVVTVWRRRASPRSR
ncbi:MAG: autotransporter-associated beta strand repeat-containing protein [Opitutaceae bacterium]|jgi:autotransporter-associated beta strand protein